MNVKQDDLLTWLYTPKGGYGYIFPVDARVVKVSRKRVKIQVKKSSGELVERWVLPENLKERKNK